MSKYILEFQVPGLPATTNAKRRMGHWAQQHRETRKWKDAIIPYLLTKRPPTPLKCARLTLVRGSSVRPDFDGLVSSFKHVIDSLVDARILVNDKHENIGQPKYQWEQAPPKKGYLKVIVEAGEPYGI